MNMHHDVLTMCLGVITPAHDNLNMYHDDLNMCLGVVTLTHHDDYGKIYNIIIYQELSSATCEIKVKLIKGAKVSYLRCYNTYKIYTGAKFSYLSTN